MAIVSLFAIVVVFGIVASAVVVSSTQSKWITESTTRAAAGYLAEAGIEAAKYELIESLDVNQDGLGNTSASTTNGAFSAATVELDSKTFEVTSTGTAYGTSIVLREVLVEKRRTRFPRAAMSLVSEKDQVSFQVKQDTYGTADNKVLLIDGGATPAFAFTDSTLYNEIGESLADYMNAGDLDATEITGSPMNTFDGVDLPVDLWDGYGALVSGLGDLYTELRQELVTGVIPSTTVTTIGNGSSIAYGSSSSPVTVRLADDATLKSGQTLTGYGVLVVSKKLVIESGANFNWNGDVIVYGGSSTDPEMEIGGAVNVTGALSVVGEPSRNAKFLIKSTGVCTVQGALNSFTDYSMNSQTQFLVEGDLAVDGLVTLIGPKQQIEFKDTCDVTITGMMQVGSPSQPENDASELQLKFEGNVQINMNDEGVEAGVEALSTFGSKLDLESISVLIGRDLTSVAWYPIREA